MNHGREEDYQPPFEVKFSYCRGGDEVSLFYVRGKEEANELDESCFFGLEKYITETDRSLRSHDSNWQLDYVHDRREGTLCLYMVMNGKSRDYFLI